MAAPINLSNLVLRPNEGTLGRPIRVRANLFRVLQLPDQQVYHYDIVVEPFLPQQKMRALWQLFEQTYPQIVGNAKSIFDGRKNVFSIAQFALGQAQAQAFPVDVANHFALGRGGKDTMFNIRLKLASSINMQELAEFINGRSSCTPNCLTESLFQMVLRPGTVITSLFVLQKASCLLPYFYLMHRLISALIGNMFVNIDTSATAMHESGPLPEIAAKILNKRSLNELRMGIADRDMVLLTRLLRGRTIQVTHRGERRISFKITNVAGPANQMTFADLDGNRMLVSDYFLQKYNRRLNYPFLPCVVVRKDTFLPMEVCEISPGQRFTRRLNPKQTAEFITATSKPPQVRFNKINQGLNLLQHKNNPYLEEFGLNVNQEMEVVNARLMEPPRVAFGQSTILPQPNGWNLQGKRLKQPATLKSWSLVNFAGAIPLEAVQRLIREMIITFTGLGMTITNRNPPTLNADPQGNIERTLKESWMNAGRQAQAEPQLIVCILPNLGSQLYGEIKRITDTVIGIPSQCLQSKHVANAKKQYCANVALKVNVKLGGSNHVLNHGEIPFISNQPTIVFGIDVSHPFPGSNAPSVAAIRLQARTEIVSDLSNVVVQLLRKFYQKTGMKPHRMLFYRDGVADSQFQDVMTKEVSAIRQACASLGDGNFNPKITFVVVQKRHRVRFLPVNRSDADRSGNCLSGLVVDTHIVHPFEFDFYLQAHAAIKGTARSAHYYVLYDENNFDANSLQDLTFKLCFSYARSTGPVSLVPAVYCADLVAARARLHRPGGDWSETTMTGDTGEMQAQMAAYATVNAKIQDTMYYM
ncbi:translation initiation factor 2C [Mucor ambiguus]|uniref:Translation initiation factor 2C n=1 Tax=Mucor ambiguus TaxID=91626 RepID=A0A0C9MH75_9FUNG|nr:translation initiation factor 2C [Mucor ambiguus]